MASKTSKSKLLEKKQITTLIKKIQLKTKDFLDNIKNANNLLDVLTQSESDDHNVQLACIQAFHKIFVHLITSKEMFMKSTPTIDSDLDKEDKLKLWLLDRYHNACAKLIEYLAVETQNIKELALCTLMKFVAAEGKTPLKWYSEKHLTFPAVLFEQIIMGMLRSSHKQDELVSRFQEFLEYDDVRYHAMKSIVKCLHEKDLPDSFLNNTFCLLENLSMPLVPPEDGKLLKFLSKLPETESEIKVCSYKEHKKLFTKSWLSFLKVKLSTKLYKNVLVILHEKVMPHMTSPLLLSDFLTQSYDIGGAISLLALNGIFILVNKFNLDYPDFFKKLYGLLQPSIFHAKYRARFFFLLDLFLTSSHLPAYLVAAFAKRLAYISLTAPTDGLTITIPLIYNLILRHPSTKCLLHKSDGLIDSTEDPYLKDEPDPAKCEALQSSLWELKTLQNHFYPGVSMEAKKMDQPLPRQEVDISPLLEISVNDLFVREKKRKYKDAAAVTFHPSTGLLSNKEDQCKIGWCL